MRKTRNDVTPPDDFWNYGLNPITMLRPEGGFKRDRFTTTWDNVENPLWH